MKKNLKSTETTEEEQAEVYYEMTIQNLTINVEDGGVVVFQSGNPNNPPPKPPTGNG